MNSDGIEDGQALHGGFEWVGMFGLGRLKTICCIERWMIVHIDERL